jgi:hypothetical protein
VILDAFDNPLRADLRSRNIAPMRDKQKIHVAIGLPSADPGYFRESAKPGKIASPVRPTIRFDLLFSSNNISGLMYTRLHRGTASNHPRR